MSGHFRTYPLLALDEALLKSMTQKWEGQKHSFLHRNERVQFFSLMESLAM